MDEGLFWSGERRATLGRVLAVRWHSNSYWVKGLGAPRGFLASEERPLHGRDWGGCVSWGGEMAKALRSPGAHPCPFRICFSPGGERKGALGSHRLIN